MKYLIAPILLIFLLGCSDKENSTENSGLKPCLAGFVVKNLEVSTDWYIHLGFELDTSMNFPDHGLQINLLQLGDFKLELIQFQEQIESHSGQLPSEYSNLHGFIKLGFLTNDLSEVVNQRIAEGTTVIAGPGDLPALSSKERWATRFYLVKDPDGNYIQFFEGKGDFLGMYKFDDKLGITPFLSMISVRDFEKSKNWYESIGFRMIEKSEGSENVRGLFSNKSFVIELGNFTIDRGVDELGIDSDKKDKVIRMSKLGFYSPKADSLYSTLKKRGYSFFYENMEADEPSFILNDSEMNYIQFFGK